VPQCRRESDDAAGRTRRPTLLSAKPVRSSAPPCTPCKLAWPQAMDCVCELTAVRAASTFGIALRLWIDHTQFEGRDRSVDGTGGDWPAMSWHHSQMQNDSRPVNRKRKSLKSVGDHRGTERDPDFCKPWSIHHFRTRSARALLRGGFCAGRSTLKSRISATSVMRNGAVE